MHGNRKILKINERHNLYCLYYVDKLSQKQIAKKVGCSIWTVQRRMKEFGIKGREWTTKGMKFPGHITPELRKKLVEGLKKSGFYKRGGYWKGKKRGEMSEEWKKKISLANSGNKSYKWKGGISNQDKLERVKFKIKIQKKVFERDNYTCQICGKHGIDLQVDHIQPWAEYIELRFCIDNCRTLCAKCHYKITFGKPMPPTVRAWGHNILKGGINL